LITPIPWRGFTGEFGRGVSRDPHEVLVKNAERKVELLKNLGEFIRARRQELKLTQEDVAYAAKVEQTVISKIERGVYSPSEARARRIALALSLSENALFKE